MPILELSFQCEIQETMLEHLSVKSIRATNGDPRMKKKRISLQVKSDTSGSFFVIYDCPAPTLHRWLL